MRDLAINFTLREGGGEWAPSLSLLPTLETVMWDTFTPRESILVPVTLELDGPSLQERWQDYLEVRHFEQLRGHLRRLAKETHSTFDLRAHRAGFAVQLKRSEKESDVVISGQVPAADYAPLWEYHFAQDPFGLRKWMRTSLSFEFWMEPERLVEPLSQVDAFLGYFQEVYEGRVRPR